MIQNLEVEVKFQLKDPASIRQRLQQAHATLKHARYYERNTIYDTLERRLQQNHQLIRLREDQRVRLTFKGLAPAEHILATEAKIREEIEVELTDYDQMEKILNRLGFTEQKIYEKYRETWLYQQIEIVIDEMPFGYFIELEGSESDIKSFAHQLGLSWHGRINCSYWELMEELRTHYKLPFKDITFALFATTTPDAKTHTFA